MAKRSKGYRYETEDDETETETVTETSAKAAVEGADITYTSELINTSPASPTSTSRIPQVEITHEKKEEIEANLESLTQFVKNRGLWHEYQTAQVQAAEILKQTAAIKEARGQHAA